MKIIERFKKELIRIGASGVVCWELFPGEKLFQLADEQWQSDYMYSDKVLDLLCDIIDNAGRVAMWEYLKFKYIPLMSTPQTDKWHEGLRLKRLKKKGNST